MKKVFVPEGYGRDRVPEMEDLMAHGDGAADVLSMQADWERRLQRVGEELGLQVVEAAGFPDALEGNEFTVRGHASSDIEEIEAVRQIDAAIQIPRIEFFDEFDHAPHFPVVAKPYLLRGTPWHTSQGKEKFLIETPEQWRRLRAFLLEKQLYFPQGTAWEGRYADNQPLGKDAFYFQEFVETPSDRYTTVRVMVTATGHILASSLHYSHTQKGQEATLRQDSTRWNPGLGGDLTGFLTLPNSPVYLDSKAVFSNRAMGGDGIVLNPNGSSKAANAEEQGILEAHNFDPRSPKLPDELARLSSLIAQQYGKRKGLVVGIDWIQGEDGKWRYLETNVQPGVKTYIDANMGGQGGETEASVEIYKTALRDIAEL